MTVLVARKASGADGPVAMPALFVRAFGTQLQRPKRPGRAGMPLVGRRGHDFELQNGFRLLPVAGPQAVRPRVAAADNHNTLAGGKDLVGNGVSGVALVLLRQEV